MTDQAVQEKLLDIVARALDRKRADVHMTSRLAGDLGAESLDLLDIAFSLEREFRIRLPRTDLLRRASEYFGEDVILRGGVVTKTGLDVVRRAMPEIDPALIKPGLTVFEFFEMITVESLYRVVQRLLEAKQRCVCSTCSTKMADSPAGPELICPKCGETQRPPSGENILMADLDRIAAEIGQPAPRLAPYPAN